MAVSQPAHGIRRFLLLALLIALPIPVTVTVGRLAVTNLERAFQERAESERAQAWRSIESDFRSLHVDLLNRAERLATDPEVIDLLKAGRSPDQSVGRSREKFTRLFRSRHSGPAGTTLELFDVEGNLVGWSGAGSLPQPLPATVLLPETRTSIEEDAIGKALTIWVPVAEKGRQLGAIRANRTGLERGIPSTPYLKIETLSERWRSQTPAGLDVVLFGLDDSVSIAGDNALQAQDGTTLGRVHIRAPHFWDLALSIGDRYTDVAAFWTVLLVVWLYGGLIVWLRSPARSARTRRLLWGPSVLIALWLIRAILLKLDVPARWFENGSVQTRLFDPVFLASSFGLGTARSAGDLLLTSVFLLATALLVMVTTRSWLRQKRLPDKTGISGGDSTDYRRLGYVVAISLVVVGLTTLLAAATRRTILDSTLDYFAWTGLTPEPLVLVVFCSLILCSLSVLVLGACVIAVVRMHIEHGERNSARFILRSAVAAVPVALVYAMSRLAELLPFWIFLLYAGAMWLGALYLFGTIGRWRRLVMIRTILMWILISTGLLYPLFYKGMDVQRRTRVEDRADEFGFRSDAQTMEVIRETVRAAVDEQDPGLGDEIRAPGIVPDFARSLLSDVMTPDMRDVRLTLFDSDGRLLRRYLAVPGLPVAEAQNGQRDLDPGILTAIGADTGQILVNALTDGPMTETRGYVAVAELGEEAGILELLATRRHITSPPGALFGYEDWRAQLSTAEFIDGVRVRTEGDHFERFLLPEEVQEALTESDEVWKNETVYERPFLTYYRRNTEEDFPQVKNASIIAVRARAVIPYDHLYYLLRLALASLWLGLPLYILGLALRLHHREGTIRTRFSDRVLDTFLGIGLIAVISMGLLGQQVINRENEGAIRSRLQRRLQRVENALVQRANQGEPLYEVLGRMPIDSLATELSLDLSVYTGPWLTGYSKDQEEALPLVGKKLPLQAFDELYLQRYRQSFVENEGERGYVYTIGYKAFSDDEGTPQSVVAVLTIPEQARIREERARTTAYLYGALLLLLLVIMATATVLAGALSRPIRRLRDGLEAVAQGKFQKPLPVPSRDEVGELVETFNVMQDQLVDSRRRLAQQQREMAWREMAKQVAHEIKNPLTPMKLSIQHLQRAFANRGSDDAGRFQQIFKRITATLSEQVETLANIANEFSTFARMPRRDPEILDANTIIQEAISLLQGESGTQIIFERHNEPLVVHADREELRRVYINVLKNASEAAGGDGRVTVRTRIETETPGVPMMMSEVIDNGPGIPSDLRDRIFEPNFSTKTSGMGLGLAIAKKSIEDMQGEIGYVTNKGRGTTFWISLPLAE